MVGLLGGEVEAGEVGVQVGVGPVGGGLAQQHVGRTNVAVNDVSGMRGGQGVGDLRTHGRGEGRRHRPALSQQPGEVASADVRGDEVGEAVVLAGVVDGEHVGRPQCGEGVGVAAQAGDERLGRLSRLQDGEGHDLLATMVGGSEDLPAGAADETAVEAVVAQGVAHLRGPGLVGHAVPVSSLGGWFTRSTG